MLFLFFIKSNYYDVKLLSECVNIKQGKCNVQQKNINILGNLDTVQKSNIYTLIYC
jgi:hypothetical protein